MILKMYSVYDSKVNAYATPNFMHNRGYAMRAFEEAVNDKASNIGKYPQDFTLFEIGEFDDASGLVTSYDTPISLGVALEFVKKE